MEPVSFGNYTLLRRIATGGTAEIFLARRHGVEGFARHLAIKRILPHLAENPDFVQLLLDEARLAAHLHHGHIVEIHEVGVESDQAYIAMEYLPGTDVGRLLQAGRKRRRRVLVVDGEATRRARLANALRELRRTEVVVAADSKEALERSAEGAVDLAVVQAELLGPMRDPMLHRLQTEHPELLRTIILGKGGGRGHGVYAVCSKATEPDPIRALAQACLRPIIPIELSVQILRAVADGLEHAHSATDFEGKPLEMVHRDVNPSNVLVSVGGMVKLVDFGIARATTTMRPEDRGMFAGTYHYMSPEQAAGKVVDSRSDLFSLGTLIQELISGTNPYRGDNQFATMRAIQEDEVPGLEQLVPGLPVGIAEVAARASSKAVAGRHPSASKLLDEIEDFSRREGLNLSPKRLAGFMRLIYGPARIAEFGVGSTGREVPVAQTPPPRPIKAATPAPLPDSMPPVDRTPKQAALPDEMEIDVELDDIERPSLPPAAIPPDTMPDTGDGPPSEEDDRTVRVEPGFFDDLPPLEPGVGLSHPVDDAVLGGEPPPEFSFGDERGTRVLLSVLVLALLLVAGFYWHWRG